jgi:hypothetical protein
VAVAKKATAALQPAVRKLPPIPGRVSGKGHAVVKEQASPASGEPRRNVISVGKGWEYYRDYSKTASEITRQLGLAGLAVIWIFKTDQGGGKMVVPPQFFKPALLLIVGLTLDLSQYVLSAEIWRVHTRRTEKRALLEFDRPAWLPWVQVMPYWLKILSVGGAYVYLISFLARSVFPPTN